MPVPTWYYREPWFGFQCCTLLLNVSSPDTVSALAVTWVNNGWGQAHFRVFPTTPKLPACFAAVNDTQVAIGISGTDSISQVWEYTRFDKAGIGPGEVAINDTFDLWGETAAKMIVEFDDSHSREVILMGHSYGGAVATACARHLILAGYRAPIVLVTFGCPKYCGDTFRDFTREILMVQWINYGDPVPALPPSEFEVGIPLYLAGTLIASLITPQYKFLGNGQVLQPNGDFKPGGPRFLTPSTFNLSREELWINFERFGYHFLRTYRERLKRWKVPPDFGQLPEKKFPRKPLVTPVPKGFPTQPIGLFPEALKAANLAFRQRQITDADAIKFEVFTQLGGLFNGGKDMPFVPSNFCARKVRVGGQKWQVFWMDQMIATGDRTRCHSLVKVINHFLRRLQVMDGWALTAFQEQVTLYSTECSAGGLGFKPDVLPII